MQKPPKQLNLSPATRAAQALHIIDERTGAISPMIDLSSTYARDENYDPRQPYIYARNGGQTVKHGQGLVLHVYDLHEGAHVAAAVASRPGAPQVVLRDRMVVFLCF